MEGQMYGNVLYRWMMWMMLFCHGICMVQYDPNESRKRCCAEVFLYGWVNLKPSLNTHSPKTCDVGAKICGNGSWQNSVAQIVRSKDKSDLRIMLSLDKLFLVLWFGTLNAEWELCKNCLNRDAFGGHFCGCFFWGGHRSEAGVQGFFEPLPSLPAFDMLQMFTCTLQMLSQVQRGGWQVGGV